MSERILVHEVSLDGYKVSADSKTLDFGTWGSYGIEKLHLTLGKAWEGLVITAHFNVKGEAVATALADVDNMIQVPWEATKENTFAGRIVFAGSMNGQRRLTANLNFKVTNHADYEASDPAPTDDKWNQFVTETKGYREDALAAANRALQSEQTSNNAKQEVVDLGNEKQNEIRDLSDGQKQAISELTDTKLKALQDESAAQQAAITKKGADTLATIPEEYTQLNSDVGQLKEDIADYALIDGGNSGYLFRRNGYYSILGNFISSENYKATEILPVNYFFGKTIKIYTIFADSTSYCVLFDADKKFIKAVDYKSNAFTEFCIDEIISSTSDCRYVSFTMENINKNTVRDSQIIKRHEQEEINRLQRDLDLLDDYVEYTGRFENGAVSVTTVDVGEVLPDNVHGSAFSHIYIPCKQGEVYEICGVGNASAFRLWCFLDDNRIELSRTIGSNDENNRKDKPLFLEVPKNATTLLINMNLSVEGSYVRKKRGFEKSIDEINNELTKIKHDITSYKIALPAWAEVHPFKDYSGEYRYTNTMNGAEFGFDSWYAMYHELVANYSEFGLSEVDIGKDFNSVKNETTPSYIDNIKNGKMVMFHLAPPDDDNSGFTVKHKKLKVMLFSGVHGGERKSIWDNYILLKELCASSSFSAGDPLPKRAIINMRNFVDLYVVPLVNISGIDSGTRNNKNPEKSINLNRDFKVSNWVSVSDSSDKPNSQWETRVISYIIDKINPDVVVDHHTSSGDNRISDENPSGGEYGKFIEWGDSDINEIMSLIEENLMEITPYVKQAFPEKLGKYNFVFGHTEDAELKGYGNLPRYAYQHGAIALTYEVVQHLRWTPIGTDRIFGFSDSDEIQLASINYFGYINMIMKILDTAKNWLNNNVDYKYKSID